VNYPTLDEVNAADHYQVCKWYRFLPSPGMNAIEKSRAHWEPPGPEFEEEIQREVVIMNRISDRLKEFGGFTPEISKSLGWDK
jgi:hypothetical protein